MNYRPVPSFTFENPTMNKAFMRIVFCGVPSLCVVGASLFAGVLPIGLILGGCLFGLGWQVTKDDDHA